MTFCPGKKQVDAMSGAWNRDLGIDLQAVKDWGATVLVSLIEHHEFSELRVRGLSRQTKAFELDWIHLPIQDVSIPSPSAEKGWQTIGIELAARLKRGENIVLHCKGGLGRTGMMAACLLREFGMGADEAIKSVRVARHGAIETREQEKYVRSYRPFTA
jgi:ADP-ribosyl-[dinitrogen reductase] hydrolase